MKALIQLSLDESEQDRELTVLDAEANETVLHAAGGQCHVDIPAGARLVVLPEGMKIDVQGSDN